MNAAALPYSVATRVAGSLIALAVLAGLVRAPLVWVVGALGLATFGRALLLDTREAVLAGGALALVTAAVAIGALRWSSLAIDEIRGAQAVLGPTLALGPASVSAASWGAGLAGVLALPLWLAFPAPAHPEGWALWASEAVAGALLLVSVYWGPKVVPGAGSVAHGGDVVTWASVTTGIAVLALGLSLLASRVGPPWRGAWLAAASVAVAAAAAGFAASG